MRDNLGESLRKAIMRIRGAPYVDEKVIKALIEDLENALIAADVNLDLVLDMTAELKQRALRDIIPPGVSRRDYTLKVLYDELTKLLGKRYAPLKLNPDETTVLMFIGIQGSGKTTSIGKVANYYQRRGFKVGVIGGDTFRPGALAQLQQNLAPINVEVFGDEKEKKALAKSSAILPPCWPVRLPWR